ncbi:hypothetical protein SAY87_005491 [Trapa incisa]|uniref:Uncharacterized protein n=1 Tax=Trapa incisa TaxID=236973 RepID=A0AAN7K9Z5_9MYRT|nr:hypothetical protein SAY87_005491 [Trapa incisa]
METTNHSDFDSKFLLKPARKIRWSVQENDIHAASANTVHGGDIILMSESDVQTYNAAISYPGIRLIMQLPIT